MNQNFTTNPFDSDKLHEKCGVFGIIGHDDAAAHCTLGLHALQHRGQEGAGIVSCNDGHFYQHMAFGKVGDNFNTDKVISKLKGNSAIGHNRYSTSGEKARLSDIQPIFAELNFGGIALAHNGNLTNALSLRKELVKKGSIFHTTMDTEALIHLMATSEKDNVLEATIEALKVAEGAYSLVMLTKDALIGARDPHGVRPLLLGKKEDGSYVLASETCAFDIIDAKYVRDIEPGEIIAIDNDLNIQSFKPFKKEKSRFCIFEYVYFSRPDSFVNGDHIYDLRKKMGAELVTESPVDADVVVPVPDSGVASAIGYSQKSGIPFEMGIIRNHYVGRTFIEPADNIRHLGVKLKHNANMAVIKGKRVILVDDSIVRGTTSKKIVDMVREAGAKEVHVRISCPPTTDPCFYGVDTPEKSKLLASTMSVEDIRKFIGADSLSFLSVDALYRAVGEKNRNNDSPQYCDACYTGEYPIPIKDKKT